MNKKYQKPTMKVEHIQHQYHLLGGSIKEVTGNVGLDYGGDGNGPARSRHSDVWDDCE